MPIPVLILIDIQNDFCPNGALPVPFGDEVVAVANSLMRSGLFEEIIASKDWHPANHVSFAAQHSNKAVFDSIDLNGAMQVLWPTHCVQGSKGAELHEGLDQSRIGHIIHKGTDPGVDSYSAFFDNMKLKATPLLERLQLIASNRGVTIDDIELTLCGLATDYCVAATARDARELGFVTNVIVDGCRAVNMQPDDEVATLRDLAQRGVVLRNSRELLEVERESSLTHPHLPTSRGISYGI
jgi:nicotinamidase/pyrazinamidase